MAQYGKRQKSNNNKHKNPGTPKRPQKKSGGTHTEKRPGGKQR